MNIICSFKQNSACFLNTYEAISRERKKYVMVTLTIWVLYFDLFKLCAEAKKKKLRCQTGFKVDKSHGFQDKTR